MVVLAGLFVQEFVGDAVTVGDVGGAHDVSVAGDGARFFEGVVFLAGFLAFGFFGVGGFVFSELEDGGGGVLGVIPFLGGEADGFVGVGGVECCFEGGRAVGKVGMVVVGVETEYFDGTVAIESCGGGRGGGDFLRFGEKRWEGHARLVVGILGTVILVRTAWEGEYLCSRNVSKINS